MARRVSFKRDAVLSKDRQRRFQCGFGCGEAPINADLDQDFHNGARRKAKLQRGGNVAAQLRLVLHGTEHRQRHRHAFLAGQAGAVPDIAIDKLGHQIAKAKGAIGQGSIARAENLSALSPAAAVQIIALCHGLPLLARGQANAPHGSGKRRGAFPFAPRRST